ncbi:MAG TPA: redoxin domain-containing protein [Acidimicrobiales bacterium]|nr:redoxin domain-containing protein [Acidimicrobiales bacterium]
MADVVGVVRLVLVGVFLVAGWAKLSDRPGTREAIRAFGVPAAIARPGTFLLPIGELAIAVGLVISGAAAVAAVGALVLLGLFIVGISVNLARGRRPECNCFGQVHSEPIGPSTLARNVVLAAGAALVVAQGSGAFISSWIDRGDAVLWVAVVGGGVIAVMGWFIVNLTGMQGRLLERVEQLENAVGLSPADAGAGLPVGVEAPGFELPSAAGDTVTLETLLADELPVVLVFTSSGCAPCANLIPEIAKWERDHARRLRFAVIGSGDRDVNRAKGKEHALTQMLLEDGTQVADAYQYLGTPGAVVISADGRVASPVVAGPVDIGELVDRAASGNLGSQRWVPVQLNGGNHHHDHNDALPVNPGPPIGTPAPDIALPDLSGNTVSLASMRGAPTLVLFWRQTCGYCAGMLDDLRAWDTRADRDHAPQLLVVSTGTVEEHQTMGLVSPVVIDPTADAMSAYGANGTPMAVLVDADGLIASEMAVGANAVLALVR